MNLIESKVLEEESQSPKKHNKASIQNTTNKIKINLSTTEADKLTFDIK